MLGIAAAGLALACAPAGAAELREQPAPRADTESRPHVPGELLVRFDKGTPLPAVEEILRGVGIGGRVERWYDIVPRLALLDLPPGLPVRPAIDLLEALNIVSYAEPNWVSHVDASANDYYFSQQWGLRNTGAPTFGNSGLSAGKPGADVMATRGWDGVNSAPGIYLAIIDTGLAGSHPDIAPNYRGGIDITKNPPVTSHTDAHGHGTMVAGVAGAVGNNGIGVAGVAWKIGLIGLKVDEGSGYLPLDKTLLAYQYLSWSGVQVANIAFGHHGFSEAEYQAINALANKTTIVVSAGNNRVNVDPWPLFGSPVFPCSYAGGIVRLPPPNLICVNSTDKYDQRVPSHNWGPLTVGLSAPGLEVVTTWNPPYNYVLASGTSVAAPFVSGAAALVLQRFPGTTPPGIVAHLKETGDPLPSLNGYTQTGKRLNLWRALGSPPAPPEPRTASAPAAVPTAAKRSAGGCTNARAGARSKCSCKKKKQRRASRCSSRVASRKVGSRAKRSR